MSAQPAKKLHQSDGAYQRFYEESIRNPKGFWSRQSELIDWHKPFDKVLDDSKPPFARWFVGGETNLCHNAVDRHLAELGDKPGLIFVSTETDTEQVYTFNMLHDEVQRAAAMLLKLGVKKGDVVLIYMPMIPQAAFTMLACARIGAIHSVVFGGFASHSLASRIDDAKPVVIVSADAGSRAGKVVAYKPLLDEAIKTARHKPAKVLMFDRGLAEFTRVEGRDEDYASLHKAVAGTKVPVTWLKATDTSYVLYTSGTTGKPKGVQRDVGGYAVALAASMKYIFMAEKGTPFFSTSDIGWVVGHSYIIYGPLIAGMSTVMYEGLPIRPDGGIWWKIVQDYKVTGMFSAPTAVRVLRKQDPKYLTQYDISSLKALFLAGEPLDEPTANWISGAIGKPVVDNYWQTETGWPILAIQRGVEPLDAKLGSPGVPVFGFNVNVLNEDTAQPCKVNEKGVVAIEGPLPPGCMQTVWGDDERFVKTYWSSFAARQVYSTFDWGIRDKDGYFFILGRTDDVINVAGHRLGTREIEECISSHPNVAEVAVVGVADQLKGQVAVAFVILKDTTKADTPDKSMAQEGDIMKLVDGQLGAVARPSRVYFVSVLPKTRSGKLLRRAIQAVCEGRDAGDMSTIEDPAALAQLKERVGR
ncbi:propionate--CoA ligase [Limnobacter sp.]|uniref:propionate--CoA ligase n=1 Tax=Limnobacter sp. TaxID=2003368 RepID=UPI0025898932|nr:propionate--CoA ligase [Limnobacter sp.]